MFPSSHIDRATDQRGPNEQSSEIWYALVGPGDVRQMSVDQLDDWYQIGYINEQTHLWKAGMNEWSTLEAILAEPPTPQQDEDFHVLMPDRTVRVLALDALDALYQREVIDENTYLWQTGMSDWKRLSEFNPVEAEVVTSPVATRELTSDAATVRYHQCPTALHSAPTVRATSLISGSAASAPPVSLPLSPDPLPSRASHPEVWLVRLFVAAGLLLVLGRNDALLAVASTAKRTSLYLQTEQRVLGGPSFGTSRAIDNLIAELGGPLLPVRVPVIVPARFPTASPLSPIEAKPPTVTLNAATSAPPASSSQLASPASSAGLANNVAAALEGKVGAQSPLQLSSKSGARRRATFKAGKLRGSTNYYDPLNGSL